MKRMCILLVLVLTLTGCSKVSHKGDKQAETIPSEMPMVTDVPDETPLPTIKSKLKSENEDKVAYYKGFEARYTKDKTLIIGGKGKLNGTMNILEKLGVKDNKVNKIIVKDSIQKIGSCALSDFYNVKSIQLSRKLKKLPMGIFVSDYKLAEVNIPDGVTKIGGYAFECCKSLKKLVLPKSLKEYKKSAIIGCFSLKKIVNNSKITVDLTEDGIPGEWYCDGIKVTKLGPGKTAILKSVTYKIHYDLDGGHQTKKLPNTYKAGKRCELPVDAVKKGNLLQASWRIAHKPIKSQFGGGLDNCIDKYEKGELWLKPQWYKYKIYSRKKRQLRLYMKLIKAGKHREYTCDWIGFRISKNKDMTNALYLPSNDYTIKSLKSGCNYYVEYAYYYYDPEENDEEDDLDFDKLGPKLTWKGKTCVKIK